MFLADKPWPSRKNPLYVTGKLRRLEDVIVFLTHALWPYAGHLGTYFPLVRKVGKGTRRENTGFPFRNPFQRRPSPMNFT